MSLFVRKLYASARKQNPTTIGDDLIWINDVDCRIDYT